MWAGVADALGEQVLAPDLYSLGDTLADWATAVLDMANGEPLVLVGNSVGGSCAIEVTHRAPADVRGLVLIGAKASHRPEPAFRDAAVALLETEGMAAAWREYWLPLLAPTTAPPVVQAAYTLALSQSVADVVRGVKVFHGRPDRTHFLDSWAGPVTVVNGEYDQPARGRALANRLRQGRFVLLPEVGHYPPVEAPYLVGEVVMAYVDQVRKDE